MLIAHLDRLPGEEEGVRLVGRLDRQVGGLDVLERPRYPYVLRIRRPRPEHFLYRDAHLVRIEVPHDRHGPGLGPIELRVESAGRLQVRRIHPLHLLLEGG